MRHILPKVPVILVGLKNDLRSDESQETFVSDADVKLLSKEISAFSTLECSALTRDGVRNVFDEAVRAGLSKQKRAQKKKSKCNLL